MRVPRRYGLLRFIAFLLKLLAWCVLLAGIAGLGAALMVLPGNASGYPHALVLGAGIALPVIGLVGFLKLFIMGSVISLLLQIEEDSRALAASPPNA